MHPYTEKIKQLIAEDSPQFGTDVNALWEMLYMFYTELNPINSIAMRDLTNQIMSSFRPLTVKDEDTIFGLVNDLYVECERKSFFEGMKFALRLMLELYEQL